MGGLCGCGVGVKTGVGVKDGVTERIGDSSVGVSTVVLLLQATSKNKTQINAIMRFKIGSPKFIVPQPVDKILNTTCHLKLA